MAGMGWDQRLREMILAGGALVAAGCNPSPAVSCANCFSDTCVTPACMECLARGGGSIAASDYDQSCSVDSDCVGIAAGNLCDRACNDENAAINVSDVQKYESDVSSKLNAPDPPWCPGPPWRAACYAGSCTLAFGLPSADAETEAAVDATADTGADASASDAADGSSE